MATNESKSSHSGCEPIAITGIGCRLPGGVESKTDLWEALQKGLDVVIDIPKDRFDCNSLCDDDLERCGVVRNRKGGFLDDVYGFDADFFGIYPGEASSMDPQQRLALEASVHAVEDSGLPLNRAGGGNIGVFMAAFMYDHLSMQTATEHRDNVNPHTAMGISVGSIANRISHRLDLRGPSITIDTACSGSMVSVHLACQSIWTGESDAALAGGVNALLRPESSMVMTKAGFLSPDGSCKPFDEAANGYVRSEGVGVVFLKPLSKALRDRDRIYATIRGTSVNSDGYTAEGMTVPSLESQRSLLKNVYENSGVLPSHVRCVEAHGPGTIKGDPIEAQAIGEQLGSFAHSRDSKLLITSIKGNFGHLEGASGVAGLIKASLMAFNGMVPPQIKHCTANSKIDFDLLGLQVPLKPVTFNQDEDVFIGVNSFGAGGTNAHAIVQKFWTPNTVARSTLSRKPRLFFVSAKSQSALRALLQNLKTYIKTYKPRSSNLAHTLSCRRTRHRYYATAVAESRQELETCLDDLARSDKPGNTIQENRESTKPLVVFTFSGQGGQWAGMGSVLMEHEPVFRATLIEFEQHYRASSGVSVLKEMKRLEHSNIDRTDVVQPAIAAIQIALARTLIHYGLRPDAIVGHSIGEIAAAHISGALSLEQTIAVIHARSRIQAKAAGLGKMLAVGLCEEDTETTIAQHHAEGQVMIAALNSPQLTVISGVSSYIDAISDSLQAKSIFCRPVNAEVPYHSHFMDPLRSELQDTLSSIRGCKSDTSLYSTVTTKLESGAHIDADYCFRNIRDPVRYVETVVNFSKDNYRLAIEIGPHPVLTAGTREASALAGNTITAVAAMTRKSEYRSFIETIAAAHAIGVSGLDLDAFNGGGSFVDIPLYPFQRKHFCHEHPELKLRRLADGIHPFNGGLSSLTNDGRGSIRLRANTKASPFLADHLIDNTIVFPATAHIEVACMAAKSFLPHASFWLQGLRFEHPLLLSPSDEFASHATIELTSAEKDFVVASRAADAHATAPWQICSRGRINILDKAPCIPWEPLEQVQARLKFMQPVDIESFYSLLERSGVQYGASFRNIKDISRLGTEIYASIAMSPDMNFNVHQWHFHPALLDSCLHALYADVQYRGDPRFLYLPSEIGSVHFESVASDTKLGVHIKVRRHEDQVLECDARIHNPDGSLVVTILGLRVKRLPRSSIPPKVEYEVILQDAPHSEGRRSLTNFRNVLVLDDDNGPLEHSQLAVQCFPDVRIHSEWLKSSGKAIETMSKASALDRRDLILVSAFVPSEGDVLKHVSRVLPALLDISRIIHAQQGTPTVMVITNGAFKTASDQTCNPVSGSVEAAVRVLANELPSSTIRVVDMPLCRDDWSIGALKEELSSVRLDWRETVVILRDGSRFVRQIRAIDTNEISNQGTMELPARGGAYICEADPNGILTDISIRQQRQPMILGEDEIAIEVHATSLNFKDVMNTAGLLDKRAVSGGLAGQRLGLDVAGRVTRVGTKVTDIATDDHVMARVSDGLAGLVKTHQSYAVPVPGTLSTTEAASVPVAYLTAYYSLVHLGRLCKGETVLIHAAAGGVGGAALEIAKLQGARIFATAGSPQRRAWAKDNGAEEVFDSRSVSFRDQVLSCTGGKGVDVILNCLTGTLFTQSLACLAAFGRFLELGKMDIYRNARIGLEVLGQNCSFFVVDVDRMAAQKPLLHSKLMSEVVDLFEQAKLPAPRITKYLVTELSKALKSLSRSEVLGKAVITMPESAKVEAKLPLKLSLAKDRTYLITGGTSGLGLQYAIFLANKGASTIILASRSGAKTHEDLAWIAELERRDVTVVIEQLDVADLDSVRNLFSRYQFPPISGVIHCAAILRDTYSYKMAPEDFWAVFMPKAVGAWNLHLLTEKMDLEFFVMTSSISSCLGLVGQLNYAAANQFLDSLSCYRCSNGLPGLSLNLGVLGQFAGMSKRSSRTNNTLDLLDSYGLAATNLPWLFSTLEDCLIQGASQRISGAINWELFLESHPQLLRDCAFQYIAQLKSKPGSNRSSTSQPKLTYSNVIDMLRTKVAKVIGADMTSIAIQDKIDKYGFDSMILKQIQGTILRDFRVNYPAIRLFQGPSLQEMANEIVAMSGTPSMSTESSEPAGRSIAQVAVDEFDHLDIVSKWLVRPKKRRAFKKKLVLFHPMGVGATFWSEVFSEPPDGFDILAIQLPGRENRAHEPLVSTVAEVVTAVKDEIGGIQADDVFWGHSFGGILAFETIKALRISGSVLPRLVVTGTIAPHLASLWQKRDIMLQVMADDYNTDFLLAVSKFVDNQEFVRSILPAMRKDFPLLATYQCPMEQEQLGVSIVAFAARRDDMVYRDEIEPWSLYTSHFTLLDVDGDHWFLHRNFQNIRDTLQGLS